MLTTLTSLRSGAVELAELAESAPKTASSKAKRKTQIENVRIIVITFVFLTYALLVCTVSLDSLYNYPYRLISY